MLPEISIIVPVYNVKPYLKQCIESILNQHFKNYELIIIDDGSTDGSSELIDEFVELDSRIIAIHKDNGGISSARNAGLSVAKGKYIGFVDSDDYISPDMYQILHNDIEANNTEISICSFYIVYKNYIMLSKTIKESILTTNIEALKIVLENKYYSVHMCNKLFKKDLFSGIIFPEGKMSEDAYNICEIFLKTNNVYFNNKMLYFYRQRKGSYTHNNYSKAYNDTLASYHHNLTVVDDKYPEILPYLYYNILTLNRRILHINFKKNPELKSTIVTAKKFLRSNIVKNLSNPLLGFKGRIYFIIATIFPNIYSFFYRLLKDKQKDNLFD